MIRTLQAKACLELELNACDEGLQLYVVLWFCALRTKFKLQHFSAFNVTIGEITFRRNCSSKKLLFESKSQKEEVKKQCDHVLGIVKEKEEEENLV